MRSSRWHAHGNVYLLAEQADLTPERVRAGAPGTDGIVEVLSAGDDEAEVVIWNPDGSTAELSGNGVRIAARWLAEGRRVRIATPPEPGTDFNDVLMGRSRATIAEAHHAA